jgi:hypothetical protein
MFLLNNAPLPLDTPLITENGLSIMEPVVKRRSVDDRFYFTGKPCKYGHVANRYVCNNECAECRKAKNIHGRKKQAEWEIANKERKNAISRYRYYSKLEEERERTRRKYAINKEKVDATNKAWAAKNPGIKNHYGAKRRAAIRKQVPLWADVEAIKQMYTNCPKGYHVDHILPLQGRTVCGFHSQHNLQYLPASENQRKYNRLEESYVSAQW